MLVKNLLALLMAGVTLVTATNNTNSSSSDAGGASSSANPVVNASSSSANPVAGSSSSSNPVAGSSSSANPVAGSSSSANPVAGSSSSANPVAGSSSANPVAGSSAGGGSSSAPGNLTGGVGPVVPAAPVKFKAEVSFAMSALPSNATAADLMVGGAGSFKAQVETSLATAAGVSAGDVSVYAFVISGRRQLSEKRRLSGKTVTAKFTIKATTPTALTAAKNTIATTGGMVSLKAALTANLVSVTVAGASVTFDTAQTITPATTTALTYMSAGTWAYKFYSDATCATALSNAAYVDATASLGTASNCALSTKNSVVTAFTVAGCSDASIYAHTVVAGTCPVSPTLGDTTINIGGCSAVAGVAGIYEKFTCTPAAGATSDASTKSIAGVVMGLVMGLIALM